MSTQNGGLEIYILKNDRYYILILHPSSCYQRKITGRSNAKENGERISSFCIWKCFTILRNTRCPWITWIPEWIIVTITQSFDDG